MRKDINSLGKRREPTTESKSFTPISPKLATFVELDESEVEPRNEPAELDKDVRGLVPDQASDVGYGDVEHGEGLFE